MVVGAGAASRAGASARAREIKSCAMAVREVHARQTACAAHPSRANAVQQTNEADSAAQQQLQGSTGCGAEAVPRSCCTAVRIWTQDSCFDKFTVLQVSAGAR